MAPGAPASDRVQGRDEVQARQPRRHRPVGAGPLDFGTGFSKAELLIDGEAQNLKLDLAPRFTNELGGDDDEAVLLREGISTSAPSLNCGDGIDNAIAWPASLKCGLL